MATGKGWHVEPRANPSDGVWRIADDKGHRLRRRFYTDGAARLFLAKFGPFLSEYGALAGRWEGS